MSVEVIAIGGYEEVGKNLSAKPLKKVSSKFSRKSKFLIHTFKDYRFLINLFSKKVGMEVKNER